MINRNTIVGVGIATLIFMIGSIVLRDYNSGFLGVISGICWGGFLLSVLALIVLSVTVLVRAARRGRTRANGV
jgi:hypothetical protein